MENNENENLDYKKEEKIEIIEYEYPNPPKELDIPHYCNNCDLPDAIYKCSACKEVFYCSESCQRNDWKTHKKYCGKESSIFIFI